jgi:hypothetical protein
VNATTDGFFVAKQLAEVIKNGEYDLCRKRIIITEEWFLE